MTTNTNEIIEAARIIPFELRDRIDLDDKYSFGIEIEFEDASFSDIKNIGKWKLEDEMLITVEACNEKYGGELISPILYDVPETWTDINSKCKKLVKNGAIVTQSTGAHIHIGSQILGDNPDNIRRMLKKWELFENIIYYFSYGYDNKPRAEAKRYAKPIGNKLKRIRTSLDGYKKYKKFYDWINYYIREYDNKARGINLINYCGCEFDVNNTIEVRCPNGALSPELWQNNINFFTKFLLSSDENKCDEELIDHLLLTKKYWEYKTETFDILDIDKAIMLSDMTYDNEKDKLLFIKQYLKMFTEEEKSKNHSV